MTTSIYRELTGKRRRFLVFSQLYLGPDHLLLVRSNRFEERYQRFYFKDIHALVITGLPARTWLQALMGVLAAAIFLLAFTLVPIVGWRVLLAIVGVVPATVALIDYLRGERCQMILKTVVSNEPLPAVSRMSTARLVLSRLRPAIELTQQGAWTPEMVPAQGPPVMAPAPLLPAPANRLIIAVFSLISLDALVYVLARVTKRNEALILLAYSVFTEIILALTALRRRGGDPRWVLYSLSGVVAVCATLDIFGGIGLFGFFIFVTADDRTNGTTNVLRFLQLAYPQAFLWWGFGWRIVIAVLGWANYFLKIERAPETPSSMGDTSLLQ